MSGQLKLRSPQQKLRKMLNEEKMIVDLELAIKKEQFQKTKLGFNKMTMENKDCQIESPPVHETNLKTHGLNFLLNKIGF